MTKTTVYCDSCSRLIEADRTCLDVECGPLRGRGFESIDLCPACCSKLVRMLEGPSPDLAEPPVPALAR